MELTVSGGRLGFCPSREASACNTSQLIPSSVGMRLGGRLQLEGHTVACLTPLEGKVLSGVFGERRQGRRWSRNSFWKLAMATADGPPQDQFQNGQADPKPKVSSSDPLSKTLPGLDSPSTSLPRKPVPSKPLTDEEKERRERIEDELKDSRNFFDYLAPRPLRRILYAFGAASCFVGFLISLSQLLANSSFQALNGSTNNVGINLLGGIGFAGLYVWEGKQAELQKVRRKKIREAQIKRGDREVYTNESGEKMSRLKPVDDEWIIRRLDRWGAQDGLPQIGPKKGALLQDLIRQQQPQTIVEVGTFTGYSAIKMAQAAPKACKIISIEKDLKWVAVAKRFISQAKMSKQVDVRWGEAVQELQKFDGKIDLLLLDAVPSEYIDYLKAAEPKLSEGALVVADNAGLYSSQMQAYLDYVQKSGNYESRYIASTLEYRDDVTDGLEVSTVKTSGRSPP